MDLIKAFLKVVNLPGKKLKNKVFVLMYSANTCCGNISRISCCYVVLATPFLINSLCFLKT